MQHRPLFPALKTLLWVVVQPLCDFKYFCLRGTYRFLFLRNTTLSLWSFFLLCFFWVTWDLVRFFQPDLIRSFTAFVPSALLLVLNSLFLFSGEYCLTIETGNNKLKKKKSSVNLFKCVFLVSLFLGAVLFWKMFDLPGSYCVTCRYFFNYFFSPYVLNRFLHRYELRIFIFLLELWLIP